MTQENRLRVIIAALGSHGDVHPFLGIARALRDRGHEIKFIAPAMFQELVQSAGFEFFGAGSVEEFDRIAADPDLWNPAKAFYVVVRGVAGLLEPYYRIVEQNDLPGKTVLVISSLSLGARVAQEKLGIPSVSVHLSPTIIRSLIDPPRLPGLPIAAWQPLWLRRFIFSLIDALIIDPSIGRPLNAFRKTLGLPRVRGIFRDWLNSPERVIGLFPDWFCPPAPDWPGQIVLTGFPLYDESDVTPMNPQLMQFLESGEAPIAFTPGSAMRHGKDFFQAAVDACTALNRRGLLLSRHHEHLPSQLPPGVRHVEYAPFGQLLPRCAAIVHHGGIGTSAQGMAAGIPHVVMPMAHDQMDNAHRLEKLGVAAVVPAPKFNALTLRAALERILNSGETPAACAQIKSRFHGSKALSQTADWIEKVMPASTRASENA